VSAVWTVVAGLGVLVVALVVVVTTLRRRLELVARAEHELRGPVTVLALGLELLRRDPAARRRARTLEVELERMRAGLADLNAARSGGRAGRRSPVALERLVRGAAAGWEPAARRLGREVRLDWRAGPARVRADRGRLAQVLGNLLSNAVEHGRGAVELRGRPSPRGVRVEVRDAGGLPAPARRPSLPGRRRSNGRSSRGRGLAIAAEAVEEAGGSLSIEDADETTGATTVAVELPLAER
jgi:signal transduction histidine kinase